jgi:hypothetical protein
MLAQHRANNICIQRHHNDLSAMKVKGSGRRRHWRGRLCGLVGKVRFHWLSRGHRAQGSIQGHAHARQPRGNEAGGPLVRVLWTERYDASRGSEIQFCQGECDARRPKPLIAWEQVRLGENDFFLDRHVAELSPSNCCFAMLVSPWEIPSNNVLTSKVLAEVSFAQGRASFIART